MNASEVKDQFDDQNIKSCRPIIAEEEEDCLLSLQLASLESAVDSRLKTLQNQLDVLSDNQFIQLQLIHQLKKKPSALQANRIELLKKLIEDNGGKIGLSEARKRMGLKKNRFSELLAVSDAFLLNTNKTDRRKKYITLK